MNQFDTVETVVSLVRTPLAAESKEGRSGTTPVGGV